LSVIITLARSLVSTSINPAAAAAAAATAAAALSEPVVQHKFSE